MATLAELQSRLNQIQSHKLPTLKAEQATLATRQQEAEDQLKELGWDGKQDLEGWLEGLADTRDEKLSEAEAMLKEAEDALNAVGTAAPAGA